MAKRFKLNTGDIFTIPINEHEVGFGQIIDEYDKRSGGFRIAVYDIRRPKNEPTNLEDIVNAVPLFVGYTFDTLLIDPSEWKIIGNCTSNIKNFVSPYFRLGFPPDEIYLMDAAERRVAEISEDIFNELTYKTEIAPIRYENALKAHFGFQEWKEEDYDKILYKHTLKSHEIARKVISDLIVPESD